MSAFYRVFSNRDLLLHITSFQKGKKWNDIYYASWACKNGHLSLLKHKKDLIYLPGTINVAIHSGHLHIVQWLYHYGKDTFSSLSMDVAASKNRLNILVWIYKNTTVEWTMQGVYGACKEGNFGVLQWMHSKGATFNGKCLKIVVECGRLDILQWLVGIQTEYPTKRIDEFWMIHSAAKNGYFDIVMWFYDNVRFIEKEDRGKYFKQILHFAAEYGRLDILKWFYCCGLFNDYIGFYACKGGHLNILQWLLSIGKIVNPSRLGTMNTLATKGYLHILEWMYNIVSFECTQETFTKAVKNGHYALVEWFIQKGFVFVNDSSLRVAVKSGNLDLVKKFYRKDTKNDDLFVVCALHGYLDILEWLHNNGYVPSREKYGLALAVRGGHSDIVDWLLQNTKSRPTQSEFLVAVEKGLLSMVKNFFSLDENLLTEETLFLASKGNHLDIVQWYCCVRKNSITVADKKQAFLHAIKEGHINTLKWISSTGLVIEKGDIFLSLTTPYPHVLRWLMFTFIDAGNYLDLAQVIDYNLKNGTREQSLWLSSLKVSVQENINNDLFYCSTINE